MVASNPVPPRAACSGSIEHAILAYLQVHPKAVDTERGIREWWLRGHEPFADAAAVRAAIERLVGTGRLAALTLPDGHRAYTLARGGVPRVPT